MSQTIITEIAIIASMLLAVAGMGGYLIGFYAAHRRWTAQVRALADEYKPVSEFDWTAEAEREGVDA